MKLEGLKERINAAMDKAIAEKRIVGTALFVLKDGQPLYQRCAGLLDREAEVPMREDAIFRLASLSKPIVAATALVMIDEGLFGLDDAVIDHLPYFAPTFEGRPAKITVRHLLTHTSGLSYDAQLLRNADASGGLSGPVLPLEENVRRFSRMPLRFAPGAQWEYSVAIDVVGCLIATINRSTLDEAVQRYVTGPLGMADTRFGVTDIGRLAVPYADGRPEPIRVGDTHQVTNADGTPGAVFCASRIFNPLVAQSGGAGMAGTGPDFLKLLEALRTGTLLKPDTKAAAFSNQIGGTPRRAQDAGKRFGFLGAVLDDPAAARSPAPRGTLDWGGVYGHNWILDPVNNLSVVSMSNTGLEGCNGPYREEIRDAIYGVAA